MIHVMSDSNNSLPDQPSTPTSTSTGNSDHLEEVSTEERIKLVEGDNVRRWGQLIIAFILVGFMLGYLGWFLVFEASDEFQANFADKMETLAIMGVGAALAIFGLGRTVGRR